MHKQSYQIAPNESLPQKLSLLYIQQGYFHRIQIRSSASLYKLNVKLKKPIILILHSLPVLKHIIDHSEVTNSILQMENIHEIKLDVPGYGVFNQKYQLQRVSQLFLILSDYCKNLSVTIKKIALDFPGWRTFSNQIISNFFKFISKCEVLEEFSINLNHAMTFNTKKSSKISDIQIEPKEIAQKQDQTFYGKPTFEIEQFQLLMKYILLYLPKTNLTKIQLRFGAWSCVGSSVLQTLIQSLKKIYESFKNLKIVKIDLHGWGNGYYEAPEDQIQNETVNKLFRTIQEFDGDNYQILQIDMRSWPSKYGIKKYKDKFQYLSGGKRKDETKGTNIWSMTGTNFQGSQLRSKVGKRIKIQIKD